MQENNFEKQVQQKMEELKIKPSEEVWQKVAVNIAKGKRDRRVIAYLFFLFLFIGSVVFIIRDQNAGPKNEQLISGNIVSAAQNNATENIAESIAKQKAATSNNPTNNSLKSVVIERRDQNGVQVAKERPNQQTYTPEPVKQIAATSATSNKSDHYKTADSKDATDKTTGNTNSSKSKTKGKVVATISTAIPVDLENKKFVAQDTAKANGEDLIPGLNEMIITHQLVEPNEKDKPAIIEQGIDTIATGGNTKVVALEAPIPTKQKSKWKIGVNFSLGIAATQNGYLGVIGTGNGDGRKSYFDAAQITGSNPGQAASTIHTPSNINPGPGLVLGFFMQKSIFLKANLLFGLNYSLYSSSMSIGNKVDSSFNYSGNSAGVSGFYYSSGNSTNYKNYFHFLELPVDLQFKLSKQNKRPLYLNTGISISQLLGSNALQFESQTGAYYNNNNMFNKTQFNLSAGLLFALSRKVTNPFLIGPDMNYSISKMANSGLFKDSHYSYFGILVQKHLGNK